MKTHVKSQQKPKAILTKTIAFRVDEETYQKFQKIVNSGKVNKSTILRRIMRRIILINLNI